MNDIQKSNARRLASVLERYVEDPYAVNQIAHYLNYMPKQLAKDMVDLQHYLSALEELLPSDDDDDYDYLAE